MTTTNPAYPIDPVTLLTETKAARELGARHAGPYQSAEPYNQSCIDNFLLGQIIGHLIADLEQLPAPERSFNQA